MTARAELLRRQGHAEGAIHLLLFALEHYPARTAEPQRPGIPPIDEAHAIAVIAQSYLDLGEVPTALAWIERGRRDHLTASISAEKTVTTFAEWYRAVKDEPVPVSACRPVFEPGLRMLDDAGFAPMPGLVELTAPRPRCSWNEFILFGWENDWKAASLLDGVPGPRSYSTSLPDTPMWAELRHDWLVAGTRFRAVGFALAESSCNWVSGDLHPLFGSTAVDPEIFNEIRAHAVGEDTLILASEDGRIVALRIADGLQRWHKKVSADPFGPVALNDEHVAVPLRSQQGPEILILGLDDGREHARLKLPRQATINWLQFAPDRSLLVASGNTLAARDPRSGQTRWTCTFDAPPLAGSWQPGTSNVYLLTLDGEVTAVSYDTGEKTWRAALPDDLGTMLRGSWLDRGELCLATDKGAISLSASDGTERWRYLWPTDFRPDELELARNFLVAASLNPSDGVENTCSAKTPSSGTLAVLYVRRTEGQAVRAEVTDGPDVPLPADGRVMIVGDRIVVVGGYRVLVFALGRPPDPSR